MERSELKSKHILRECVQIVLFMIACAECENLGNLLSSGSGLWMGTGKLG